MKTLWETLAKGMDLTIILVFGLIGSVTLLVIVAILVTKEKLEGASELDPYTSYWTYKRKRKET